MRIIIQPHAKFYSHYSYCFISTGHFLINEIYINLYVSIHTHTHTEKSCINKIEIFAVINSGKWNESIMFLPFLFLLFRYTKGGPYDLCTKIF